MKLNIRYEDKPNVREGQPMPDLCNIDLYVTTRNDLVAAQQLINALLLVLPLADPAATEQFGAALSSPNHAK